MTKKSNEGIIISGGNITAGALGVGHAASARQVTCQGGSRSEELQKIDEQLQQLLRLLSDETHSVPSRAEVVRSAEKVKEELSREKPSKLTITSLLDGIAHAVSSIGTISTAVAGIKAAIGALL